MTYAYRVPDDIDFTDPRARAYWGVPNLTPERLAAWEQWKTDYVVNCMENFLRQGSERDEVLRAGAVIRVELDSIDGEPWMPMGIAKSVEIAAMLDPDDSVLGGSDRIEFLVATRTSVTSTQSERNESMGYSLGVSAQHAGTITDDALAAQIFSADEPHAGRTALYRHYDHERTLLYVGIAKDPDRRHEQHGYNSRWFQFVADTSIEWFATRADAQHAEREAIRSERPVFNGTHNKANRGASVDYLFAALSKAGI